MMTNFKKVLTPALVLSCCFLNSCSGASYRLVKERMFFDIKAGLRYQYVDYDVYLPFEIYHGRSEVNILDSYQLPDSFLFETETEINIIIPYSSSNNFCFQTDSPLPITGNRRLQRRTNIENVTNSRDARRDWYKFYKNLETHHEFYETNICIRYNKNNGNIFDLNHELIINVIYSRDFYFHDTNTLQPPPYLGVYFWDMFSDVESFDYESFDGEQYQKEMYEKMTPIRENDLIKGRFFWDDGEPIDNAQMVGFYDMFYYGPPDPTYEIVV